MDRAVEAVKVGGYILALDVPEGIEFGCDYMTWTVGKKFKGVKAVPPGAHYIHTTGREIEARTGCFILTDVGTVIVRVWNPKKEALVEMEDKDQAERFRLGVLNQNFDDGMGMYPLETLSQWRRLSRLVTASTIEMLAPIGRLTPSTERKELDATQTFSHLHSYYTPIPTLNYHKQGFSSEQITKLNLDRTSLLKEVLQKLDNDIHLLLGEISYAFVNFLLGQCLEGLEQWRCLIELLCFCQDAVDEFPDLYLEFLTLLREQMEDLPHDFFHDPILEDNFLQKSLVAIFETLRDSQLSDKLRKSTLDLAVCLDKRFKFKVEDEIENLQPEKIEQYEQGKILCLEDLEKADQTRSTKRRKKAELCDGSPVLIRDLKKAQFLNGACGRIMGSVKRGRFPVQVAEKMYQIKPTNLSLITKVEFKDADGDQEMRLEGESPLVKKLRELTLREHSKHIKKNEMEEEVQATSPMECEEESSEEFEPLDFTAFGCKRAEGSAC